MENLDISLIEFLKQHIAVNWIDAKIEQLSFQWEWDDYCFKKFENETYFWNMTFLKSNYVQVLKENKPNLKFSNKTIGHILTK